jgi:peptidoglycan/LPS O-acetylase OafA/YrhL
MAQRQDRLIGLELLRFMAAVGVLVWHYQHFLYVGPMETTPVWTSMPFYRLLAPFYTYGYAGVELFWCLSGFIFTWKYGAVVARGNLSFGRFALLRVSRLYPLHLATLLIVAALQWIYFARMGQTFVYIFNDTSHFVMNLFFANYWGFQSGESFNGPSWSVSAEVLIYIAFFWVARPAGSGWRIDLLMLIGFSIAPAVSKALFGIKPSFTGAGTFFYLGAVVCHLHNWIRMLAQRSQRRIGWGCAATVAVSTTLVATHVLKIAGASLAMYPAAVLLVQFLVRPEGEKTRHVLMGLGNLTYASYMVHFPMQLATMLILMWLRVPVQPLVYSDWFMLAYLGSVLTVAFGVFRWVERPAQNWLRRRQGAQAARPIRFPV